MKMLLNIIFMLSAVLFPMQGQVLIRTNVYDAPNESAVVLGSLEHGDIVEVISQDLTGQFYEITYNDGIGWVLANYVWEIDEGLGIITTFPDFNASVKYNTFAYNLVDGQYQVTTVGITKDSRVKLLNGYDNKKEYTEVQIILDGNLHVCYVLTEAIAPDGVNPAIIISISLITTSLGIIFIFMGVRFTKKHRKENSK